jgi:hypothetical protein
MVLRYFECLGLCSKSARYTATLKSKHNIIYLNNHNFFKNQTATYFVSELNPLRGIERFLVLPEYEHDMAMVHTDEPVPIIKSGTLT